MPDHKDPTDAAHHADNQRRLMALESRMTSVEREVAENTALTVGVSADTRELLDLFRAARGGLKVMGWLGGLLKWLAGIAAAFAAIYAFIQNIKVH